MKRAHYMKNNKLLIMLPFVGTLVTTLSGCNRVYEYGTMNNLIHNHWNCGVFTHCPFETKAEFDSVFDKKEIVIKNLNNAGAKKVDSINPTEGELFSYSNSILHKETNCHYNSVLTLYGDGYIKIAAINPNSLSTRFVNLYKISPEKAKKINDQVTKWFDEVKEMEKEFLEFATIENYLKTASERKGLYALRTYKDSEFISERKVDGKFAKKMNEATFTYLGSEEELDLEFRRQHFYAYYEKDYIFFNYTNYDGKQNFGGYNFSRIDIKIFDDGVVFTDIIARDKSNRSFWLKSYYSIDENKAKEIIEQANEEN